MGGGFGGQGLLGGALGPVLGSQKPRQTPQQYTLFDPNVGMGSVPAEIQGLIRGQAGGGGGVGGISAGPNPFVRPGPQQTAALGALENWYKEATPAFSSGLRGVEETVGGKYLDPMQTAPFQRLSEARQQIARDLYEQAAGNIASKAQLPYRSSARMAQQAREGSRLANLAAQDIAQAGWGQYGAERGLQDQAMRTALGIAPSLAQQVFAGGEQIRGAEQAANVAHMQAQIEAQRGTIEAALRSRGLDQNAINQYMTLLKMSQFEPIKHIVGKSPWEENLAAAETAGKLMGSMPT